MRAHMHVQRCGCKYGYACERGSAVAEISSFFCPRAGEVVTHCPTYTPYTHTSKQGKNMKVSLAKFCGDAIKKTWMRSESEYR
jgi:hypothetical protein